MKTVNELLYRTLNDTSIENITNLYIFLERYVNNGSPSGFGLGVPEKYNPTNYDLDTIKLGVFHDARHKHIQTGEIPSDIRQCTPNSSVTVIVHPRMIEEKKLPFVNTDGFLDAIPTASVRTFLCIDNPINPYFIKCHYPWLVGRFMRDMPLYKWLSSLERSREVYRFQSELPKNTAFLHEGSGIYFQGETPIKSFGCIYREFNIRPTIKGEYIIVPAFSLFAVSRYVDNQECFVDLLMDTLGMSVADAIKAFVFSVIDAFIFLSIKIGLIPECNAQNVLYEISLVTKNVRVVIRDFEDFFVDESIRKKRDLHMSFCSYKIINESSNDFYERKSFAYDFKLSHYLILPILKAIAKGNETTLRDLKSVVKEYANSQFAKYNDYFKCPDTWYAYPKKINVDRSVYIKKNQPLFR